MESLGLKYDLVNARGLRGAGIWALGYDGTRPELYALLKRKFREDSTTPTAGVVLLPSTTRDASIQVRWTGRDDTAVERYDVQVSVDGGPWSTWLDGTARTSATYRGDDGHGYAFRVRARDTKGHWSPWDVSDAWRSKVGSLKVGSFVRVTDGLAGPARVARHLGPEGRQGRRKGLASGSSVARGRGTATPGTRSSVPSRSGGRSRPRRARASGWRRSRAPSRG